MPRLNQQGVVSFLTLLILLGGIVAGTYLVQQRTNLFPQAKKKATPIAACQIPLKNFDVQESCNNDKFKKVVFQCADSQEPQTIEDKNHRCLTQKQWRKIAAAKCQINYTCPNITKSTSFLKTVTKTVTTKEAIGETRKKLEKANKSTQGVNQLSQEINQILTSVSSTTNKKEKKKLAKTAKDKNRKLNKATKQARKDLGEAVIAAAIQKERLKKLDTKDSQNIKLLIQAGIVEARVKRAKYFIDQTHKTFNKTDQQINKLIFENNNSLFNLPFKFLNYLIKPVYAGKVIVESTGETMEIDGIEGVLDENGNLTGIANGNIVVNGEVHGPAEPVQTGAHFTVDPETGLYTYNPPASDPAPPPAAAEDEIVAADDARPATAPSGSDPPVTVNADITVGSPTANPEVDPQNVAGSPPSTPDPNSYSVSFNEDRSLTVTHDDGRTENIPSFTVEGSDGSTYTVNLDGSITQTNPDGTTVNYSPPGETPVGGTESPSDNKEGGSEPASGGTSGSGGGSEGKQGHDPANDGTQDTFGGQQDDSDGSKTGSDNPGLE